MTLGEWPGKFAFNPFLDFPLVIATVVAFVVYFNFWAVRGRSDTTVKLTDRLPAARLRVALLFSVLLAFCWLCGISFSAIFLILLIAGIALGILAGDAQSSLILFLPLAYLVREWAFGFPELILQPVVRDTRKHGAQKQESSSDSAQLIGQNGTTVSPLKPFGDARIGDQVYTVVSDHGQWIDLGSEVVVSSVRNGKIYVKPAT